jgi:uroporphyrinogen III methyltransferase/synthase
VVLYDRLVNPALFTWAPENAKWIDAGKTPRGRRMEQSEIHRLLLQYAKKGKRVVRLKGGDPFVFGRGGEEAQALSKARIPFEVVPGITSGIAAPAFAGIPITQRGLSSEVTFRIGTQAEGSTTGKTLVGYMTVEGLGEFLLRAQNLGFSRTTPAGLIGSGTCHDQKTVFGTINNLAEKAKKSGVAAPAIVVVGPVVDMRRKLAWWEKRPLAGKRVILTMSRTLGSGWRERLEGLGAEVWELPMSKIEMVPPQKSWIPIIERSDWLVFTSSAAVRAFPGAIGDLRKVARAKFAVVGKATAEVLRSIGFQPDWIGPGPGGEALARSWPRKACGSILHLTGSVGDGKFVSLLRARGRIVRKIVIYKNSEAFSVPVPVSRALKQEGADWVVFASGSAAVRFRQLFPLWRKGEPRIVVIGPATAKAARSSGWKRIVQSSEASVDGCLRTML